MGSHGSEAGIWKEVEQDEENYIDLLRRLLQASASGEEMVQKFVAGRLSELGCRVEVVRQDPKLLKVEHDFATALEIPPGERVSVVGTMSGAGGGRDLLFFAHPDAEPVRDIEGWEHDPFAGEVEENHLYGWGAADDLLGVATMLSAAQAVRSAGLRPRGDVILASTASKRHAQGIIAVLDRGYRADGAVYLHPAESGAGLKEIKAFTSGMLRFRVHVQGRPPETAEPSHTAFYHLSVNPIDKAWMIYSALEGLSSQRAADVHHPLLEAAIGRSTNLHVSYLRCGSEDALGRVPAECTLAGSIAFPPGESMSDVKRQVAAVLDATTRKDEWLASHPPKLEWLAGSEPAEVPAAHPLYAVASNAIASVTGEAPEVYPLHSASDIRNPILHAGIPTVGFGSLCGDLSQAGGHDEWVDLEDYLRAVKACASIILNWCDTSE